MSPHECKPRIKMPELGTETRNQEFIFPAFKCQLRKLTSNSSWQNMAINFLVIDDYRII